MSVEVRFRRGTSNQHTTFTGALGEVTVDTTNKTLRVHDGVTAGGTRIARYSEIAAVGSLANTNAYIAANALIERQHLANTNAFIRSQLANTNTNYATKVYVNDAIAAVVNAAPTLLNTLKELADAVGNNASFSTSITNSLATKASNTYVKQVLANTNLAIARINTNLTGTNTAIRLLVADRLQVANAVATYATKVNPTTSGLLAHTGRATISTNLAVSGNTTLSGLIANGSLGSSNYTLRTNGTSVYWAPGGGSTTRYLEVANAVATFQTIATERAALANTNTFIATKVNTTTFNSALANTNTFIATKVNTTTFNSALANTNSYIAANALVERQHLANTNTFIATKVNTTTFNSALANTNAFIKAQLANTNVFIGTKVSTSTFNAALANTNTNYATKVYVNAAVDALVNAAPTLLNTLKELSSAIGDDANFAATIATSLGTKASNTYVKTLLANTNAYIATKVNTTTFNSALANTNSFIAANALIERQHLANTNASITNVKSGLTATNTAIRLLVADRLQVANAAATYQTKATERAALANTNAFIVANALIERQHLANTNSFIAANALIERQHLANTNAYIASVSTAGISKYLEVANAVATFQTKATERAALANTNLRINLINTNLTGTNTAIRTLVSDRLQVANAAAIYQTKAIERAALANTNLAITNVKTGLTTTNTALRLLISDRLQVANAAVIYATKSNPTTSGLLSHTGRATISTNLEVSGNTVIGKLVANGSLGTSGYALKTNGSTVYWDAVGAGGSTAQYLQVANAVATFQTKAVERAALANTNLAINNVKTGLTTTNTALRTLISDRLQVANAAAIYQTKVIERAALANTNLAITNVKTGLTTTNTAIRTLVSDRLQVANAVATFTTKAYAAANSYVKSTLANTNLAITNVKTGLTTTNTALRTLISDRLQVANAVATFQTKAVERAALANTNLAINNVKTGLTSTNTSLRLLISDRLQVANAVATFTTKAYAAANSYVKTVLANTNLAITNVKTGLTTTNTALRTLISDRLQVANAAAIYQTKAVERAALANTNLAITNVKTGLTTTNTALRTLISDRLQVANAAATFQTKVIERAALANTNLRINLINTNLTGTNTAIRTLVSDRLQVANAAAIYATKSNPTTSGLLAHTGRATISTNLNVSGNTVIGKLVANGSLGTSGYALKTNGSTVYWGLGAAGPTGPMGPKSITIAYPASTENITFFWITPGATLSRVRAVVTGTSPSVTYSVLSGSDRSVTTDTHVNAATVTSTTTGTDATIADSSISANVWVFITITATSGTVNSFSVTLEF